LATRLHGRGLPWSFRVHGTLEFDNVDAHAISDKVRLADRVVCVSDFSRAQLMRLVEPEHWSKLVVVHCGVEPAAYAGDGAALHRNPVEILTVGRLEAMKGFPLLIDAFAQLVRAGIDVRLTVVGDGPDAERLRGQVSRHGIADRVTLTGALDAEAVTQRLSTADIFCLPSFAEGVPVVLMEAMAAGVPVVSTRVMGIPELVEDETSGLLVAPGRVSPLVAALRRLAEDPATRRAMGRAGRAAIAAGFDVDTSAGQLLELFRSVEPPHARLRSAS
jgi:glycosyltransferase involved in cell wall biosynthesis